MAKTFNLNPGADATLVNAAYRAAMANVPKDLSGTFQSMAANYANTMRIIGNAWEGVAKNIGSLAGEAASNAIENINYGARGLSYQNEDGTAFLTDTLDEIKGGLLDTWTKGNPLSRENRAERIKLRQKRDKVFGQIDMLDSGVSSLGEVLANGTYDEIGTGYTNMRIINAAQAMKTSSGKTKDGDYLIPGYDENNDLTLTLYDKNGVVKNNNEEIKIKPADIDGLLVRENPDLITNIDALFKNLEDQGYKRGGKYIGFVDKKFRNSLGKLLKNGNNLHHAMNQNLHYGVNFLDDLKNPEGSITSANIFGKLNNILPTDSQGNQLKIEDSNNSGGIDDGDFANKDNYAKLFNALTDKTDKYYDENTTRKVFLDWAQQQGEDVFNYGKGNRPASDSSNLTIQNYEYIKFGNQNQTGNTALKVLSDMPTGTVTDPRDGSIYNWKGDGWYNDKNENVAKDNDALVKDVLQVMDQRFYGIANPTGGGDTGEGDSGDNERVEVVNDKTKQYGFGVGKQGTKQSTILSSLQSFDANLKTVGDLQTLLGKVESDPELKKKLIDHLNKQMGTSIRQKHLDDIIKDLISNTRKKLK